MNTKSARNSDQAFVLHTRSFRNSSLIVEVFAREYGRLSMVARGARQSKSGFYSVLQPFIHLYMEWGGNGEMPTLYAAEIQESTDRLLNDKIYSGFYLNELLIRLLHKHDPHPVLFDAYKHCLREIRLNEDVDISLRYFEIDLLEQLGYGINLEFDAETGEHVRSELHYSYLLEHGPRLHAGIENDSVTVTGKTLQQMQERNLTEISSRKQAKILLRTILDHYLGHKPLKTRELVQSRSKLSASTITHD
jgi:DNA repair protein RecO (recombination protein O)